MREFFLLIVEDDPDDQLILREALRESSWKPRSSYYSDGERALGFLRNLLEPGSEHEPLPDLILLDLKLPRLDGKEILRDLKGDPGLRRIPVVAMSTSQLEEDIDQSYELGAAAFLVKPDSFTGWVKVFRSLAGFWEDCVFLPLRNPSGKDAYGI